eukprot:4131953-Lingulodinium_polyedra.AAC.1
MPHGGDAGGRWSGVLIPIIWMVLGARCQVLMEWLAAPYFSTTGVQQLSSWLQQNHARDIADLQ